MNVGQTLFAQVMEFVPWKTFGRIIERHQGDAGVRTLGCADLFKVMRTATTEAEKRSKLDAAVLSLSKAIQESCKPFLGGDAPQQADFALAPKLHHLSVAAPAHKGWAFPEGSGPVSDYLERMRARPAERGCPSFTR